MDPINATVNAKLSQKLSGQITRELTDGVLIYKIKDVTFVTNTPSIPPSTILYLLLYYSVPLFIFAFSNTLHNAAPHMRLHTCIVGLGFWQLPHMRHCSTRSSHYLETYTRS